jgi:hypothetical protein
MADTYSKLLGLPDQDTLEKVLPKPVQPVPAPAPLKPPVIPVTRSETNPNEPKMSTKPQVHIVSQSSPPRMPLEKLEKYTTHLEPSLIKKVKLHAAEQEMKDYQVIRNALLLYFEKHK